MADRKSGAKFRPLAALVESRIADGLFPGAVVAIGRADGLAYQAAFGRRALSPRREPMSERTVFDLASLTKVMATAPLVVDRAVRGVLSLLDPVERHLAETRGTPVGATPLHLLLTHTSGLTADNPVEDYAGSKADLLAAIVREPLESPPGTKFTYSDVGYVILQVILERAERRRLDRIARPASFSLFAFATRATASTPPTWRGPRPRRSSAAAGCADASKIPGRARGRWAGSPGTPACSEPRRRWRGFAR